MSAAGYTFLPWVRHGLARAISARDEPGAALAGRATLPVTVDVEGAGPVSHSIRLYGPGDVVGLDARQIVRTDPLPGAVAFEPGYLPQVQFARADLPWLFTPATAGSGATRLRPWLVLLAVRRSDAVRLVRPSAGPLPVLELDDARAELPDLSQSWAWAHAQISGLPAGPAVADVLTGDPGRACSRVVCPRKLQPETAYLACLVPAFAAGVDAGLGREAGADSLAPAWPAAVSGPVQLPVYHSWEFATGAGGSFETLARRLHPAPLDPELTRPPAIDVSAPGGGLPAFDPAAEGGVVRLLSALRAPGPDAPPPWPDATRVPFQAALETLLTSAGAGIAAPVYGEAQARADTLPAAGEEPAWLRDVNLDPRLRVAAAAGARVVQERQEQLMARAWEQAGAVREANAVLHRSQLARELGGALTRRHLTRLGTNDLLAVTRPAHASVAVQGSSVAAEIRASRVPATAVSGAMRRLAAPGGLVARRAATGGAIDVVGAAARQALALAPLVPAGMVAGADAVRPALVDPRPALAPDALQVQLLERLRPARTVFERTRVQVVAPDAVWTRPDPLAPIASGPVFPDPMYDGLRQVAPDLLLPGVAQVDENGVALLESTPAVIEAYMAGLNHEIGRELLWREFPADLTFTSFRQFWDVRGQPGTAEELADIPPLSAWAGTALGRHLRGGGRELVLLVRGELLRRYPTTVIFAARALADGRLDASSRLAPMFRATLGPDVALIGFALSEEAARGIDPAGPGWYFAFEQHAGEPRFGFDEQAGTSTPQTPDELAWEHVPLSASGHVDVTKPLLGVGTDLQAAWGREAAGTARVTFQQPFRTAIHATRLLPGGESRP